MTFFVYIYLAHRLLCYSEFLVGSNFLAVFLQVITILPSYIYICIIHIYKGFQYEMNENTKWRTSHMCPQNNNFKTESLGLPWWSSG